MQSQLKVKVMSLVFKQPIQLDKDTQSDVKPRWANLSIVCVCVCVGGGLCGCGVVCVCVGVIMQNIS